MTSLSDLAGAAGGLAYQRSVIAPTLRTIGRVGARETRRRGREIAGAQAAGYGKAGVRVSSGTPVRVMAETAARAELAALQQLFESRWRVYEGERRARLGLINAGLSILMSVAGGLSALSSTGGAGGKNLYGKHGSAVASFSFDPTRLA